MLVPQVGHERRGADQPRGQPPGDNHLVGGRGSGERREGDAHDGVDDGNKHCHREPPLVRWPVHERDDTAVERC